MKRLLKPVRGKNVVNITCPTSVGLLGKVETKYRLVFNRDVGNSHKYGWKSSVIWEQKDKTKKYTKSNGGKVPECIDRLF